MNGVDLEKELKRSREKSLTEHPDNILKAFKDLLKQDDQLDDAVLANIFRGEGEAENLNWQHLDPDRIYRLSDIKDICTNYRLRFLDGKYFKGDIPHEAVAKVKALQKQEGRELRNFKIVAPANMFNLQYKDKDPLLLIPLGQQRYYLVHKWGKDLHPLRRLAVYPFRNFKSLLLSVAALAALVVSLIPSSVMMGPYDKSALAIRVIFFFYLFIAFCGMTALYGFSRLKNFNSVLWNSKYTD